MFLIRWLNTPRSVLRLVAGGTALMFLLFLLNGLCSLAFYAAFGSALMPDWQGTGAMSEKEQLGFFAFSLCCAPLSCLIEELISRAPLTLVGKLWPGSTMPFLAAIPLSIFFGWIHGGWATVPYQGTCGLILSFYYLKAGGQEGGFLRPLLVSYLIHTIYDLVLLTFVVAASVATLS